MAFKLSESKKQALLHFAAQWNAAPPQHRVDVAESVFTPFEAAVAFLKSQGEENIVAVSAALVQTGMRFVHAVTNPAEGCGECEDCIAEAKKKGGPDGLPN